LGYAGDEPPESGAKSGKSSVKSGLPRQAGLALAACGLLLAGCLDLPTGDFRGLEVAWGGRVMPVGAADAGVLLPEGGPDVTEAVAPEWQEAAALDTQPVDISDDSPDAEAAGPSAILYDVQPDAGRVQGGDLVTLSGEGFQEGSRVWFGQVQAPDPFVVSPQAINVHTPPHTAGLVEVVVEAPDGSLAGLEAAFLFQASFTLTGLTPAVGPASGGTRVTVTGEGFAPPMHVFLAGRRAVDLTWLDPGKLTFLTPPGVEGEAPLVMYSAGQRHATNAAFRYWDAPRLEGLVPPSGEAGGGDVVRLTGAGLERGAQVLFQGRPAEVLAAWPGQWLEVRTPAGEPGAAGVEVLTAWGSARLEDAFLYRDVGLEQDGVVAWGLFPARGDAFGGEPLSVFVTGLASAGVGGLLPDVRVMLGDAQAQVTAVEAEAGVVRLLTPAVAPGDWPVTLLVDGDPLAIPGLFTAYEAPRVTWVEPPQAPAAGGTWLTLTGHALPPEPLSAWFNGVPAPQVERMDAGAARILTPEGSPGPALIELGSGDEARLSTRGLFAFQAADRRVVALDPPEVSFGGGTRLRVWGTGLAEASEVLLGGVPCRDLEVASEVELVCRTPRLEQGLREVTVRGPAWEAGLEPGLLAQDTRKKRGGTSGGSLRGTLDVTVVDGMTGEGVLGAMVWLRRVDGSGAALAADQEGTATFSWDGLAGAVDATAGHAAYSTYSVLGFDATRLTIYLSPLPVPDEGGTSGTDLPPQKKFGKVSGSVVGLDKYLVVPTGSCLPFAGKHPVLCQPCQADEECGEGAFCHDFGTDGRFCLTACAKPEDCPGSFACAGLPDQEVACLPRLGTPLVRCDVSKPSIFSYLGAQSVYAEVDGHGKYQVDARPGDLAVVCRGGILSFLDGKFTPTVMGLKRHVFVPQGAYVTGQDIVLDTPLRREVRFRILDEPACPEGNRPLDWKAGIVLGTDGAIDVGGTPTRSGDLLMVDQFPERLEGALADTSYTFYATLRANSPTWYPFSSVLEQKVTRLTDGGVLSGAAGGWALTPLDLHEDLLAVTAAAPDDAWAVGTHGTILHYNGAGWTPQFSATQADLRGVCRDADGSVLAVGPGGTAVLKPPTGPFAPHGLGTPADLTACAWLGDHLAVAGQGAIVDREGLGWTISHLNTDERVLGFAQGDGLMVAFTEGGRLYRSMAGMWLPVATPWQGEPLVAGGGPYLASAKGRVFRLEAGQWRYDGQVDGTPHALAVGESGAFLVGDRGRAWQRGASGWVPLEGLPEDVPDLLAATLAPDGSLLAVGRQAKRLGPFLAYPYPVSPLNQQPLEEPRLRWSLGEGLAPSYHQAYLIASGGPTFWTIVAGGKVRELHLPPVQVPHGTAMILFTSAHAPGFSIDYFKFNDLGTYSRDTWSMNYLTTEFLLP
jgi:hypothetical protein